MDWWFKRNCLYNDICAPFLCWIHAGLLLWCRCNAAWKRWLGSIAESKSCKCADKWEFLGLCVCVLSGLVQGYKIFSMEGLDRLPKDMMKRYFRLSLPVFFISLIVYLMIKGEMIYNVQANQIVQSPWLGTYYSEKNTIKIWLSAKTQYLSAFSRKQTHQFTTYLLLTNEPWYASFLRYAKIWYSTSVLKQEKFNIS